MNKYKMVVTVYKRGEQINHFKSTNMGEIFYNVAKIFYNKSLKEKTTIVEITMDGNEVLGAKVELYGDLNDKQSTWRWEYTFENVLL